MNKGTISAPFLRASSVHIAHCARWACRNGAYHWPAHCPNVAQFLAVPKGKRGLDNGACKNKCQLAQAPTVVDANAPNTRTSHGNSRAMGEGRRRYGCNVLARACSALANLRQASSGRTLNGQSVVSTTRPLILPAFRSSSVSLAADKGREPTGISLTLPVRTSAMSSRRSLQEPT